MRSGIATAGGELLSGTEDRHGPQPLTDPAVRPRTKYRWRDRNTMIGTIMVNRPPAVSSCQPCPWFPNNWFSAMGSGWLTPGPMKTSALRRSFQTQRNWKIANEANTGVDMGRISLQNVWKWLAPSILADSMTSLGSVAM